jgi:EAL domain-containing protein (putative c-di-GMP-specific phosphodiesterase class I)
VELGTGRIVGLEALIRWNHPTRGRLLPAAFLPVAQATGLAGQLGQWTIGEACRQMSLWRDEKIAPPEIAVNLSAAELKMVQDVERLVSESAKRWSMKSDWLAFEITEAALMETTERDVAAVARLQSQGIRIAIDDFGTGYSSVDHLAGLKAGRLKIDRRFVAGAPTHNRDSIIVRSAIGLARELGMEVVAEGVETAEQCDFLVAAGCEYGQGFLFSRPVDASEAGRLLRQGVIGSYRRQPDLLTA